MLEAKPPLSVVTRPMKLAKTALTLKNSCHQHLKNEDTQSHGYY